MSYSIGELGARLRATLMNNPVVEGSLKFSIKEEGFIYVERRSVTNEDKAADCTILTSRTDLDALIDRTIDTETALMDGRLEVQGDIGIASDMQQILEAAWFYN